MAINPGETITGEIWYPYNDEVTAACSNQSGGIGVIAIWQLLSLELAEGPSARLYSDFPRTFGCSVASPVFPTVPTIVTQLCGPDNDIVNVSSQPTGVDLSNIVAPPWSGGSRTVTYSVLPGYYLAGQASFVLTDNNDPCVINPPTIVEQCGPMNDAVTVPEQENGVSWIESDWTDGIKTVTFTGAPGMTLAGETSYAFEDVNTPCDNEDDGDDDPGTGDGDDNPGTGDGDDNPGTGDGDDDPGTGDGDDDPGTGDGDDDPGTGDGDDDPGTGDGDGGGAVRTPTVIATSTVPSDGSGGSANLTPTVAATTIVPKDETGGRGGSGDLSPTVVATSVLPNDETGGRGGSGDLSPTMTATSIVPKDATGGSDGSAHRTPTPTSTSFMPDPSSGGTGGSGGSGNFLFGNGGNGGSGSIPVEDCGSASAILHQVGSAIYVADPGNPDCHGGVTMNDVQQVISVYLLVSSQPGEGFFVVNQGGGILIVTSDPNNSGDGKSLPAGTKVTIWAATASQSEAAPYATTVVDDFGVIDLADLQVGTYRLVIDQPGEESIELMIRIVSPNAVTGLPETGVGAGSQWAFPILVGSALLSVLGIFSAGIRRRQN